MMKIIAIRESQVVVEKEGNKGFVYDFSLEERYEDQDINSILARGYWEEYKGQGPDKDELKRIHDLHVTK